MSGRFHLNFGHGLFDCGLELFLISENLYPLIYIPDPSGWVNGSGVYQPMPVLPRSRSRPMTLHFLSCLKQIGSSRMFGP